MYRFHQNINNLESIESIRNGLFLWIWNPSKKSPHIGVSLNGNYFSLQRRSKQENIDVNVLDKHIRQTKHSVLLVGMKGAKAAKEIKEVFSVYSSCEADDCSCSKPIFELLRISKENGILFDILEHQKTDILSLNGICLDKEFQGIPEYTYEDVLMNLNTFTV